jgi:hypothetical protein
MGWPGFSVQRSYHGLHHAGHQWLGGLTGLSDLSGNSAISLRVVGLVLKNPSTGNPVFVARSVEELQ